MFNATTFINEAIPQNTLGKVLYHLNGLFVFLFFALTFIVWGGTGYSFGIMLLLSPLAFFVKGNPIQLTPELKWLFLALTLMFFMLLIGAVRGDPNARTSYGDLPMRFILIIPVILYLLKTRFHTSWLWWGLVAAGLICGYKSLTFESGLHGSRVYGPFNPILWGNTALIVALALLLYCKTLLSQLKASHLAKVQLAFAILATMGAILGIVLSGSRGAWLAIILFALLYASLQIVKLGLRKGGSVFLATVAFTAVSSFAAYQVFPTVQNRADALFNELITFELSSSNQTSTGLRLQMWYTSLLAAQQAPLFGLGRYQLNQLEFQLVEQGKINNWAATATNHQHSDILDALAKTGLVGVATLLLFYYSAFRAFNSISVPFNTIGKALLIGYVFFGLTDTIFQGMNGTMFFLGMMAILLTNQKRPHV